MSGAGAAALAALALAAGCAGTARGRGGVEPDDGIVVFASAAAGARAAQDTQVYVDGRLVGPLAALRGGVAVEPGYHRFELRRDGYFSFYRALELGRAQRVRVEVRLLPELP